MNRYFEKKEHFKNTCITNIFLILTQSELEATIIL